MQRQSSARRLVTVFFPWKPSRTIARQAGRSLPFRSARFEPLEQRTLLSAVSAGKVALPDSALFGQSHPADKGQPPAVASPIEHRAGPEFSGHEGAVGGRRGSGRADLNASGDNVPRGTLSPADSAMLTGLAGDALTAEIRGHKWNDLDGNGSWDTGEPPLVGWTVFLDLNQNGVRDAEEPFALTGSQGEYTLAGLADRAYTVTVEIPSGWTQTCPSSVPSAGRLYALRVDTSKKTATIVELDPSDGTVINSFLAPGSITVVGYQGLALGPDRLYYIDGTGANAHTLYELELNTGLVLDADVVDASNPKMVSGLAYLDGKVHLLQPDLKGILVWNPLSETVVTQLTVGVALGGGFTGAADLGLLFDGTMVGKLYAIDPKTGGVVRTFLLPNSPQLNGGMAYHNGTLLAAAGVASATAKRIDPLTGKLLGELSLGGSQFGYLTGLAGDGVTRWSGLRTCTVALEASQIVENVDFGSGQFTEIRGSKWHDLDGDGTWDGDEPPLQGWTVFLDSNGNGVLDRAERSAATDAQGRYAFTMLPPGHYSVAEALPSDWLPTFPAQPPSKGRLYAIWAADAGGAGSAIVRVDPLTGSILGSFPTPATTACAGPQGLALGADRLFYLDGGTDKPQVLYQLDLETGSVLASNVFDPAPAKEIAGMAYLDGLVYLEYWDADQILVWDPAAGKVERTLTVAGDLGGSLTAAADRGLLFAGNSEGNIFAIDPATGEVLRTLAPEAGAVDGGLAYLDGVLIAVEYAGLVAQRIDPETGTVISQLPLTKPTTGQLSGLAADGVGGGGAGGVYMIDAQPASVVENLDFGNRYAPASTAPLSVDLAEVSDTGYSSADDLTRRDNSDPSLSLEFDVDGTIAGAVVEVYADGVLIGSATATGSTTTITTNGNHDLADGPHAITARQTEQGKQPSPQSPALTITVDTAGPAAEIISVAPDPRKTAVDSIGVQFTEKVSGVVTDSFSLTLDLGANRLAGSEPITSTDQQRYTLGGLSPATADAGYYRLLLVAGPGITDLAGNPLAASASDEWTQCLARHTGTSNADTISFSTGAAHSLTINGRTYVYDPSAVSQFVLDGLGGGDSITIEGSIGDEVVMLDGTSVFVSGPGYELNASGFARIAVDAGAGGRDAATLRGSGGSLRLYSYPAWSALCDAAGAFYHRVEGFETVAVEAATIGRNYAFLYDSDGNDRFTAGSDKIEMDRAAQWSDTTVTGFARVYAYATEGTDTATLTGSASYANRFYGYPDYSILTDSPGSFYYYAGGFDAVTAIAGGIGSQYAYLYGSRGDDILTARPGRVEFNRDTGWGDTVATGFERVYAYASGGGTDRAYLYDSSGDDILFGRGDYGSLTDSRGSYYLYFKYFDEVFAHSEDDDLTDDRINIDDSLLYSLELAGTW